MPQSSDMILRQSFSVPFEYPVIYSRDCFNTTNPHLADLISNRALNPVLLPVIDANVEKAWPTLKNDIAEYFSLNNIRNLAPIIVPGGEASKNAPELVETLYSAVEEYKIDRHSYILVIGGGAVVDAVGYAAATAHRGIRLIRMPTTVLGQNDAAVGVKNAINFHNRKNFLGTFSPPHAVVSDFNFLTTLETRDLRAGIAEAIKVALIKDVTFFNELFQARTKLAKFEPEAMESMIIQGAKWHLNHIAHQGDPFESGSSRPLDFGHWSAHKLEELSKHDLRHGEAVAIGIAMDSLYSHAVGMLEKNALDKILCLLDELGFQLNHPVLNTLNISQALNDFQEHLGGCLCITLLNAIGEGVEVNHIDHEKMKASVQTLLSR